MRHGLRYHPLYDVWCAIKQRTLNPNNSRFADYGGRGIGLHEPWQRSFPAFYRWCIRHGWAKGLHLDRIDNDKGYSPRNCRFLSPAEHMRIGQRRKMKRPTQAKEHKRSNLPLGVFRFRNKYKAQCRIDGVQRHIGVFTSVREAAEAYRRFVDVHSS